MNWKDRDTERLTAFDWWPEPGGDFVYLLVVSSFHTLVDMFPLSSLFAEAEGPV